MAFDILIVDDEADIRHLIAGILEDEGYECREAGTSAEAFEAIRQRQPNLIILDVWLQGSEHDGLQMLEMIRKENPEQQVIMISGHATFDMAVSATKIGAYDFLTKPFKTDVLLHTIGRALETVRLRTHNEELRELTGGDIVEFAGGSPIAKPDAAEDHQSCSDRQQNTNHRTTRCWEKPAGAAHSYEFAAKRA